MPVEEDAGPPRSVGHAAPMASRSETGGLVRLLGKVMLGAATVLISLNLWTGLPLLSLWIGSHATGGRLLSMTGVVVAVASLAVLLAAGVVLLSQINVTYDRLTGRTPGPRQHAPWLVSLRGSDERRSRARRQLNLVERIVIATVVAAVIAFEVWFFFLAQTSL